nr:sporulation YhaL family protein [Heyndrickxia acidiproducens]
MADFPIWVYFVVAAIIVCAFMAIKTSKEDRELEQEWIEKEGEVYIKRMNKEKSMRHPDQEQDQEQEQIKAKEA